MGLLTSSKEEKVKEKIIETKQKLQKAREGDSSIDVGKNQEKLGELSEELEDITGEVGTDSLDSNESDLLLEEDDGANPYGGDDLTFEVDDDSEELF